MKRFLSKRINLFHLFVVRREPSVILTHSSTRSFDSSGHTDREESNKGNKEEEQQDRYMEAPTISSKQHDQYERMVSDQMGASDVSEEHTQKLNEAESAIHQLRSEEKGKKAKGDDILSEMISRGTFNEDQQVHRTFGTRLLNGLGNGAKRFVSAMKRKIKGEPEEKPHQKNEEGEGVTFFSDVGSTRKVGIIERMRKNKKYW